MDLLRSLEAMTWLGRLPIHQHSAIFDPTLDLGATATGQPSCQPDVESLASLIARDNELRHESGSLLGAGTQPY